MSQERLCVGWADTNSSMNQCSELSPFCHLPLAGRTLGQHWPSCWRSSGAGYFRNCIHVLMPIPVNKFAAGAQFDAGTSLVLDPESALSLLPSRGLSSAPAACSVSAAPVFSNHGTKKELDSRCTFRAAIGIVCFIPNALRTMSAQS